MKKYILNAIAIFTFATGLSSCGDSFLETDNYKGVDLEGGLNTVTNVSTALNGTYYQLFYYMTVLFTMFTNTVLLNDNRLYAREGSETDVKSSSRSPLIFCYCSQPL